jgi:deoxyguanosine kinase
VTQANTLSGKEFKGRQLPAFIAVEGPIAVGKTTLANRLADTFNYQALLERTGENPFLERFYQNRNEAALATQLFFLFQRAQQIQDMRQNDIFEPVRVADFLIEKDPLFARINLDADEYLLYEKVFKQMTIDAPQPDLVIYLQASTDILLRRIENRGTHYEQHISRSYLEALNEVYS